VDERYLAEATRAYGLLGLGTFRAKPYTFSLIYLRVDLTAVWHMFIIDKTFVVPPDAEEDLFFEALSLCDWHRQLSFNKPLIL
jgi:hypothetical protein